MTYHFVLALFPMLIFLLTLLGQFITIDANQINQKVSQYVPDQETASIVGGIVKDISDTASGGIFVSWVNFSYLVSIKWNVRYY